MTDEQKAPAAEKASKEPNEAEAPADEAKAAKEPAEAAEPEEPKAAKAPKRSPRAEARPRSRGRSANGGGDGRRQHPKAKARMPKARARSRGPEKPEPPKLTEEEITQRYEEVTKGGLHIAKLKRMPPRELHEIAEREGIPRATVGTWLRRGREELRELLGPLLRELRAN